MGNFDMSLWRITSFTQFDLSEDDGVPHWPCPYCSKHTLILENQLIEKVIYPPEFDEELWSYPFNGHLCCPGCKLIVSICGWMSLEIIDHRLDKDGYSPIYSKKYTPKYFVPNLQIFYLEKYYPEEISNMLNNAFSSYFADIFSTASYIRCVIEKMLDYPEFGSIPRSENEEKISLGTRIGKIEDERIKNQLKAVKWIGNAGAHLEPMKLTRDDTLQAFNIIQILLEEKYSTRLAELDSFVEKINKNKGGGD